MFGFLDRMYATLTPYCSAMLVSVSPRLASQYGGRPAPEGVPPSADRSAPTGRLSNCPGWMMYGSLRPFSAAMSCQLTSTCAPMDDSESPGDTVHWPPTAGA